MEKLPTIGGVWVKYDEQGNERLFIKINRKVILKGQYFNAYKNENKKGNQPDYNVIFGVKKETKDKNT